MRITIIFCLFLLSFSAYAADDIYVFSNDQQKQRFEKLTHELRCVVCQNQSLAESNAPLAQDLRLQVYEKVKLGLGEKEIVYYLVERYGDFVLYKPPFKVNTVILWFGPFFLLTIGLLVTLVFISRQKRAKT